MNDNRTLKKIFNTKSDGARSVGKPNLRWEDGVVQDVRILGVKNWRKVALNRDEWAKLLKKSKAHQGRANDDDDILADVERKVVGVWLTLILLRWSRG
jgi:hypothetical protein